jgi:hypothetical protein
MQHIDSSFAIAPVAPLVNTASNRYILYTLLLYQYISTNTGGSISTRRLLLRLSRRL